MEQEEIKNKYFPQKICIECGQPKHNYSHFIQPTMQDIKPVSKCCGAGKYELPTEHTVCAKCRRGWISAPSRPQPEKECRLPKKCLVKDCHNGFITKYIGGSIDSEACLCFCHHPEKNIPTPPQTLEWKESDNSNEWKNIADAVDRLIQESEQRGYKKGKKEGFRDGESYNMSDEMRAHINFKTPDQMIKQAKTEERQRIKILIEGIRKREWVDYHQGEQWEYQKVATKPLDEILKKLSDPSI